MPQCVSENPWPVLVDEAWNMNCEEPEKGNWCEAHAVYHPPETLRYFSLRLLDADPPPSVEPRFYTLRQGRIWYVMDRARGEGAEAVTFYSHPDLARERADNLNHTHQETS